MFICQLIKILIQTKSQVRFLFFIFLFFIFFFLISIQKFFSYHFIRAILEMLARKCGKEILELVPILPLRSNMIKSLRREKNKKKKLLEGIFHFLISIFNFLLFFYFWLHFFFSLIFIHSFLMIIILLSHTIFRKEN